ncbi:N-myc-interactor isoform 1-T2 [Anomaloglossus baeobatrachus]|uniref:N-myc-interactor n=1 Tax=Anomaloglossus baeobatrachus TaxID=238106 RepID=UPI003F4FAF4F
METIQQLREELQKLKEQCEEEESRKSVATLEKLEADDLKKESEKQMNRVVEKSSDIEAALSERKAHYNYQMQDLERERDELMRNIEGLSSREQEWRRAYEKTRSELQVDNKLPQKDINFTKEAPTAAEENVSDISYSCRILIQNPYVLQGGYALLTFENEEVAQGVIEKGKHNVDFTDGREEVRAFRVQLGRVVTFEVNMTISNTKINIHHLPANVSEETLKDKLELALYKSNVGGGEIQSVEYNPKNNTACITYKEDGVAHRVLKTNNHQITVGGAMYKIVIAPVMEIELSKLQIFSGFCNRSVLLSEIRNQTDSEDDIKDLVEIHFQKQSNGGGEVECLAFSCKKRLAYFEEDNA